MEMVHYVCPHCDKRVASPPEFGGLPARCPSCQRRVVVPATEPNDPVSIRNPYRRVLGICIFLGAVFLIAGFAGIAYLSRDPDANPRDAVAAVALMAFFPGVSWLYCLVVIGHAARRIDRFIRMIRSGQFLVHWSYPEWEWAAFQEAEAPLLRRDSRGLLMYPLLIGLPIALALFKVWEKPDPVSIIIAVAVVGLTFGLAYYFRIFRRRTRGRAQMPSPPDTYVHTEFVYANGDFLCFEAPGQQLAEVRLLASSPVSIEFTVRSGKIRESYRVLVPSGQETRAEAVIAALRGAPARG